MYLNTSYFPSRNMYELYIEKQERGAYLIKYNEIARQTLPHASLRLGNAGGQTCDKFDDVIVLLLRYACNKPDVFTGTVDMKGLTETQKEIVMGLTKLVKTSQNWERESLPDWLR